MDENSDIIKKFEEILKNKRSVKAISLYSGSKKHHSSDNTSNLPTQHDIILSVSKQLKAIQNADYITNNKNKDKIKALKQSSFMPVTVFEKNFKAQQGNKFETQCVSDSQLINLIQDAEVMDVQSGVTQEFDHTFYHDNISPSHHNTNIDFDKDFNNIDMLSDNGLIKEEETSKCNDNNDSLQMIEQNKSDETNNLNIRSSKAFHYEDNVKNDTNINSSGIMFPKVDISLKEPKVIAVSYLDASDNNTEVIFDNKHKGSDEIYINFDEEIDDKVNDLTNFPSSPILSVKSVKKSQKLVFDLQKFEEFEQIATPIIETVDFETARSLINSQLIGKELFLPFKDKSNVDDDSGHNNMKVFETPILQGRDTENIDIKNIIKTTENIQFDIRDEILFSSDEEEELLRKNSEEIPITCQLNVSEFDNDFFNDTMYVGFQTASNKCIQINTDSFNRAKGIFDDVNPEVVGKESPIANLVEKFDDELKQSETAPSKENVNASLSVAEENEPYSISIKNDNVSSSSDNTVYSDDMTFTNVPVNRVIEDNKKQLDIEETHLFDTIENSKDIITDIITQYFEENPEPVKDNVGFVDFKTASNKSISISKEAVEKSKNMLKDINIDQPKCISEPNIIHFEIDKENSKVDDMIKITEGEKLFESYDNEYKDEMNSLLTNKATTSKDNRVTNTNNKLGPEITELEMNTSKSLPGFRTANNKQIKISKEALLRGLEILKDCDNITIDDKTKQNEIIAVHNKSSNKTDIGLTKTKSLVSNQFKTQQFVSPLQTKTMSENVTSKLLNNEFKTGFHGFQTASNKPIEISTKSLEKSKKLFQDINEETTGLLNEENVDLKSAVNVNPTENKVVEDLLENSNIIEEFEMEVFENESNINFEESKTIDVNKVKLCTESSSKSGVKEQISQGKELKPAKFEGFKTANNKSIVVSKQALAKSKKIFEEVDSQNTHILLKQDSAKSDKFPKQDMVKFSGFKTASDKNIVISEEGFVRSKKIFDDIDDLKEIDKIKEDSAEFMGFKTASMKEVKISKQALARTKKIFEGIDMVDENIQNKQVTPRFQTASKKKLAISMEALARSSKIFEGIDLKEDIQQQGVIFAGFQTASKKQLTVSKEALARSKKIFENINIDADESPVKPAKFAGFQMASKKEVAISIEALARSRKIFEGIDLNEDIPKQGGAKFEGFQMAIKKQVTVSKEALARSKKIFENINMIDESPVKQESAKFAGFQTASNKEVSVSKEALERSKKIFENINMIDESPVKQEPAKFAGDQTASKKQVTVSKDAIEKTKKIFEDINFNENITKKETTKLVGFKTASKKQVHISDEALTKSKKIFDNIFKAEQNILEECDFNEDNKQDPAKYIGFNTASNKQVKISEEALAKSRKLLEIGEENSPVDSKINNETGVMLDEKVMFNDKEDLTNKTHIHTTLGGFQTASKKRVTVSEDAIKKSKLLFKDVTDNENDINLNNKANYDEDLIQSQVFNVKSKTCSEALDCLIDTQVLNNFEQTLYTEDFDKDVSRKSKRSGSPILSCPKPKRRKKFEIPYSQKTTEIATIINDNEISNNVPVTNELKVPRYEFNSEYKKHKKFTLKDLENIEKNYPKFETDPDIFNYKFEELLNFEFIGKRNELTDTKLTAKDLKTIFETSVNKKLIPDNWFKNHTQLIIWKLLSYEIRFPKCMENCCTARNVIDQLKYRYDRELFNTERPPLRKILEKDDVSSRCMVLCVASIYENGVTVNSISSLTNNIELLLTDGWYSIKTTIDKMLIKLIFDGRITIGSKLMVQGAELLGCEQGIAPWEDTSSIRLKITGNSTRPVKWHVKLGYTRLSIASRLSQLSNDGGKVSKVKVFVSRVYPALYVEKLGDNSTVTRSERLELLHQMKHETERQALIEKIYEEVEKEFQDQDSQESDCSEPNTKRICLETGSQIAREMKSVKNPDDFQTHLTSTQKDLLQEHTMRKRDKLIQNVQERVKQKIEDGGLNVNRNVVTLVKVRLADVEEKRGKTEIHRALLSIWKPNDLIMEIITEGSWIEIMNVIPTAVRYSELQISANRQSIFRKSTLKESDKIQAITSTLKRTCYTVKELTKNPLMSTELNEIDTVGFIFLIEPDNQEFDSNKSQFQNAYLTDTDKNIISVNFWGGLKKFGFENLLDTGQIVACVNLQKRAGNSRKNIPQYRATEYSYFTKTPKSGVARKLIEDLSLKFSTIDRRKFCEDCVNLKSNYSIVKFQGSEISPYRFQDVNLSKNKVFIDSPLVYKNDDLNLTGLDFESTFKQTDTQELSPKRLLRKKRVNEKIAKLKYYEEPPALSPIQIKNISKNATNPFKSPFQNNVASTEKNLPIRQNMVENSDEDKATIDSSPVLNKTFVKKNINPVKLNFSNVNESNMETSIDHFAEDFDGSPPLSLD